MIAYHGGPFSDPMIAAEVWRKHHAMISFARKEQIDVAAEHASSFALDNGAFSLWRGGRRQAGWCCYYRWVESWRNHPGFDFAIIPDVIDGSEEEDDDLLAEWPFLDGVPVYHLHESPERLLRLAQSYSRIALGSSGPYRSTCTLRWWDRMREIMTLLCDDTGYPIAKLHGLRMLAPKILEHLPLSSADSAMVARNVNQDRKWSGSFAPRRKAARALVLRDRIEDSACTTKWAGVDFEQTSQLDLLLEDTCTW
ncbi:MAG: hypothetical protein LC130_30515 [Bryobacterales bacterium]|nr:hypothetical protein [Bryobacterales bacterium]